MCTRDLAHDAVAILVMEDLREELGVCDPFLRRIAEQGLDLGACVDVRARLVERVDVDDERDLLDEGPVPGLHGPLALPQVLETVSHERHEHAGHCERDDNGEPVDQGAVLRREDREDDAVGEPDESELQERPAATEEVEG